MKTKILLPFFCFFFLGLSAQKINKTKKQIIAAVDTHSQELIALSDSIWNYAETALVETKSSKLLADYAEKQGFKVERGIAGMPTAFIATYGSGKPIIGILGEFDALPGLSQKKTAQKEALNIGKPGHGCGHNMFGAGSLGAALAIKEMIQKGKIKGTVRFYGTPAEETIGGKIYMARAGLFNDLEASLTWHPGASITASTKSSLALIDFRVRFYGKTAHAALDPWDGASAVDAMELYTTAINYQREHVKPDVRIHYLMEKAGSVVNVVPDYAVIWTRIRANDKAGVDLIYEKVKKMAQGAALMTGTTYKIELISGMYNMLVNRAGAQVLENNLELLGPITYTSEETAFGKAVQKALGKAQTGMDASIKPLLPTEPYSPRASTDVGDISWIVPQINLSVTTAPQGTPWHSWAVVACGGMSIGHKSIPYAAKALALTAYDLYKGPDMLKKMKTEFKKRKGNIVYKAMLPDGPPPILKN
jgi:aminobenzoyl-glutamate utilization protein B